MAQNGESKGDQRKNYILRLASYLLGSNITEEKLKNTQPLESFVDSNTNLLVFTRSEQKVDMTNKMKSSLPTNNVLRVVFYKTQSIPLNNENYKSVVNVISANGALNQVFLKSVQNVFGKELSEGNNKQLISAVNELEESLLASVDVVGNSGGDSLKDEIRSWKSKSDEYSAAFKQLQLLMDTLQERNIEELSELVESYEETCDELWNCSKPYPQAKMKVLLESMASYLCDQISSKIDEKTIWRDERTSEKLRIGIDLCDQMMFSVKLLTSQTWKRHVEHQWEGNELEIKFLQAFRDRLDEIMSLSSLGVQLEELLQEKGVREEIEKTIETAMRGMAPLAYNPFTEPNWKSRLLVAERSIETTIDRTLPILKQRLAPSSGDAQNIVISLERLKTFLCRANIKEKLLHEREAFLTRLISMLSTKNTEFEQKINQVDVKNFQFLTEIAAKIVWIRQQTTQMESIRSLSKLMLNDLSNYPNFAGKLGEFIDRLNYAEKECFDDWSRETINLIEDKNDSIALETTGKIMILESSNRELNVNYSDRLLRLLKEVRQLSSLGFNIPSKIMTCCNNGEKYYRYGVILKQIAHFYNTIDQQMIPSQQSLMLDEAIAFEKLVIPRKDASNSASKVTWNEPKQLEEFIQQLQTAEQKLSNRNRRLRNVHMELIEMVEKLMDLNLLKQSNEWRDIVIKMRSKMKDEELIHGATRKNMRTWMIHWDYQLYKAMLIQYEWGIESIQTQIPTIAVNLVFVDQKIQLRPPIEEIRSNYYKELSKFLRHPDSFKGVQDDVATKFYSQMIDRSMQLLPTIFEKAEQLISKVESCGQTFSDWLVIAQIDLEELIEENLKNAADWENQFKILKTKAREAERLPHELKFECILVSTAGVKSAIEDAIQRLFDTLTWTLRHSISTTSQSINTFLSQAIDVLSSRPQSIDEIAEANAKHAIFAETNKQLKQEWKVMEDQYTLLRSVAGQNVEQIDNLEQNWERFEIMLDSHQLMIKDQVDVLKTNVETNIKGMRDEAEKLKARWDQFKPRTDALQGDRDEMIKAIQFIKEKRQQWQELADSREKIIKESGQFGLDPPKLEIIDEIDDDIKLFEDNWLIYEQFNSDLDSLAQEEWIVFRSKTYLFDEFLQKWAEKLKSSNQTHMSVRLMKDVEHFKELSSALKFCRGDVLSADHWHEMFRFLGLPRGTTIEKLKFVDLLGVSKNIVENVDQLKQLNSRAQGEVAIRDAIQELTLWAAQTEFTLADYKHSNGQNLKIIKEWKESINSLKDSQALLQSLKSSPYYSQFTDKTGVWETRLADLDIYLGQMNEIQRKWIYLEPIFGRGALPSEASRFSRVDSEYRAILNDVSKDARLVSLCSRQSLKKSLEQIVDQLNRCQKALNQFLEQKRNAFPRFYFIGDDDLLEILGQSTNPQVIQSHMKKLFQGIDKVIFSSNSETISSIVSAEGEVVALSKPVRIVPQVETWLQQVSDEMRKTLRDLGAQAVNDQQASLAKYPSQILCLAEEVKFSASIESVLNSSKDLGSFKSQLQEKLKTYTNMKVDDKVSDLKLKSLILDLIHHIDVVDQLIENKANSINCWTWQRQLRFYQISGGSVVLRQVSSEFEYTYEYQGNYSKLVHTPLTDKCYLTLTQAMYMGLGGNPYGPAGTGKTESVKALAALMGRQVLVFNCDEGIDVTSMGRIFTGIVECGAWGCFDEFNRLDSTVLSAVSMQIQTIQGAIKAKTGSCTFANKTVQVNPNSAIFVTLNPAGKGYGGRQKMPDNLKQLFRAVVMGKPDNELIASTILYSEGFVDATSLARKIVTVFQLSRQMLSKQQHYDWGLRALKVVLGGCGSLRKSQPSKNETDLVVQALLLNTLSKLTFSDSQRFNSLVDDIFSKPNKEMAKFENLIEPLNEAAKEMNIKLSDKQFEKVFQLYEQMRQRIGVVVVGEAGSGKSTIWKVLQRALILIKTSLRVTTFNPKAVNRNKLLGNMDMDTREWSDGIITMAAREVIKDTSVHHWIVCDGDIDPEWVEALNSVLDDNRLLTMPSGERIQFGSNVNFVFETDSLKFASPATVSRMGMIYISEEDVSPKDVIKSWLANDPDSLHAEMSSWIDEYFWKCLKFARSNQLPGITYFALLRNGLTHLRASKSKTQFLVFLFNGFAPYIVPEKRADFAKSVVFQGMPLADPSNICYDDRIDGLVTYTDDVSQSVTKEEVEREDLRPFVLTADAQKYSDIVSSWLQSDNRESFVITGSTGCGKQQLLKHCYQNDPNSQLATLYCSAQSSSSHLLQLIQQNCVQASNPTGRVWKPKDRPNLILFLKSINLPAPDKYGTNELLALLHQLLTYQGFFDHNLEWVSIENIQFVGSMNPIGESANNIPPRLLSYLRCISLNKTDDSQLTSIYRTYLSPILEDSNAEVIASRMVDVFNRVQGSFKQSENIVYSFSPRDLTNWVIALLRHEIDASKLETILCFEARRIFEDRLPSEAEKSKFEEILRNIIPHSSSSDKVNVTTGTIIPGESSIGLPLTPINISDFSTLLLKSINRFEFEVANFSSLLTTQLTHLCAQVDRVLTSPSGHLFLPGRTGYGRRDAVRLISHMHNITVFSPTVTANFSSKQFDNELKNAITHAVTNTEHVVLIFEDQQLRKNIFLQAVNSLLASGNVPGLFTQQELDGLVAQVSEAASQASFTGALQQFLAHRIRNLVHVVLIMDVEADDFKINITENPSILKHCNIIYSDRFDKSALNEIPKLYLEKEKIEATDVVLSGFVDVLVTLPEYLSLQPIKYRQFVENYAKMCEYKKSTLTVRLNRLQGGVSKLNEASEEVAKMQKKSGKKSKLLAEKQAEADEALKAITESMSGAEDQKLSMEQLKEATEKENVRIEEKKANIDEQLKEVQPLIDAARKAVGSIKSESLSEIRSLRAPPEAVRDILQAVLLFMGILDTSWEAMRKFLSKSGVKEDIMNFDANRITNDIHKKVTALVKQKPNSFEEATAKRASVAAAPLAAWVKANLEYSKILEKISPLENEKNKLIKNLKKAEKQMENLSKGLQSVDEVVGDLKKKFEALMKEATQIKVDLEREQDTIRIAGTLVESLSGEFQRWKAQIETLGEEQSKMEICSLITSAFITYLGGCSEKERNNLLKAMCKMFNMGHFKPLSFASLETEQLNWKTKGLPADTLSLENSMIMFNTNHVPLLIDPSGQVPLFLSKYLEKSETFKAAQSDLMTQIELAIRFGKTIIVDDVVDFDAALIPILRKDLSSQGPRQVISFGGKQIDYNPDFRIFICTRDDKVKIRPNATNLLNIVNFTTTISALSAQLLDVAIHLEKPELEERSSSLLRDAELKKLELEKLEQLLLQQLASSQGNLLENTALLDSLNKSKESAEVISKSISESEQLHKELTAQKEIYVPLSHFASSLFFSFSNLQYYNNMYNYSVNTIMRLFEKTIKTCQDKTSTRVETLARQIQLTVFYHISRGIFRQDRLMFAVEFINATMPKLFQPKEWELFTGVLVDESGDSNSSKLSWIPQDRSSAVSKMRTHLPSLFNNLRLEDEASWKEFSNTLQCENSFPSSIDNKITPFQKVLVVQAIRPDRLYNCLMDFVLKTLNISSINPPAFALKEIFDESDASEPILFILADGADPSQELSELANSMRVEYHSISMGQGQETIAYDAIKDCAEKGEWLCLNNLHLMLAAVPFILKHLSLTTPNPNFRLWLTTEADHRFPSMMLQQSLKITFEPPPGVRNNLLRTYSQIDKSQRNVITCQSIFVLAWLHALLQERRTFIPQGWTKFYEFGASDVRVARAFVEQLTATKSDWEFVRGILKFVIYGGRIENDFDAKVLDSYMITLFNDEKINGRPGQILVKSIDLPAGSNIDEYIAHISKNIPSVDEPFLFGLPENIKYSWQIVESDRTISSIRTLVLGDSKNALKDSRESVEQIIALWRKLCTSAGDLHKKSIPEAIRSEDPIIEVLSLECINALQILQNIHNTLKYVSLGSKNPALAPANTQKIIQSLVFQQTPDEWDSIWPGPSDPADFLNAVIRKTKGTLQLLETAKSTSILSQPIDFSDLFYPNIFLNALRQTTSRQLNVPMDQLQLCSAWESSSLPNKQTVEVKGLLIQGATFDGFLRETTVSSSAYTQAPLLYLAWTSESSSTVKGEQVQVPLYTSNDRTDLIGIVNMPCRGTETWNIAAVALFLK